MQGGYLDKMHFRKLLMETWVLHKVINNFNAYCCIDVEMTILDDKNTKMTKPTIKIPV
jgi:hypothetical protein